MNEFRGGSRQQQVFTFLRGNSSSFSLPVSLTNFFLQLKLMTATEVGAVESHCPAH